MKNILMFALIVFALDSMAQDFQKKFRAETTFALLSSSIQWVDANNDSLLDVLIVNKSQGELKLAFMKNQGHDSFTAAQIISTGYQSGSFVLTDFDKDNKMDVVISGRNYSGIDGTEVFLNKGNFIFQKSQTKVLANAFLEILFTDLNNDGSKDLVAHDISSLYIYEQKDGQFILRKDTALKVNSIKSYDFDNNGFHDIAFSGADPNNNGTVAILLMKDKFKILSKIQVSDINGVLEAGDLNHDGLFDLIAAGNNSSGSVIQTFQNNLVNFTLIKTATSPESVSMEIADFTSDGKTDIAFFGQTNNVNSSWIETFTGSTVSIPSINVTTQDYGDYDRDGDIDLVQLRSDSVIVFTNNLSSTNKGPAIVAGAIGLQLYDRMFFYWKKTTDDHTDSTAVSYDLKVFDGNSTVVSAEYDQSTRQRLLVSHGNLGTANYSIQRIAGSFQFEVQSIDNAFVVQTKFPAGFCSDCATVAMQNITLCDPASTVQLNPQSPKAMWFSFNKGFLGVHDSFSYNKSESDTLFSFNPADNPSCSSIKLFAITVPSTDTLKLAHTIYNCENSQNVLTVNNEWQSVTWKNNLNSSTSTGNTLAAILQKPIMFNAYGDNIRGCHLKETFDLKISKPDLELASSQYQVAKGSSVQLIASGGDSYLWSPSGSLDNPTISSPTATPLTTTDYTVIAKDTLGCTATASVLVEVMEAGFIATLFTPNGDGKNDELKIYGLTSASNFRFTIYNREGNVLFETKDISTAIHQGWSGISNGQSQPSGTYYWKVEGNNNTGAALTLNGKKSGAFLLVR